MYDKKAFLYPVLFALFPPLFLYAENIAEVQAHALLLPVLFILLFVIASLILLKNILNDSHKASFLIFTFLFFFFAYGHLHYLIERTHFLSNQLYLFPVYVCTLFILLFFIFRAKSTFRTFSTILFSVSLLLFLFQVLNIGHSALRLSERQEGRLQPVHVSESAGPLPDFYHIVLDGYSSNTTLKEIYKYDNSDFVDFLYEKGFFCAKESIANYESTIRSLSSTLNFEYHVNYENSSQKLKRLLHSKIENNKVVGYFHSKGYRYVHISSGVFPTRENRNADKTYSSGTFETEYLLQLCQTTMLKVIPFQFAGDFRKKALNVFENTETAIRDASPKFVFMHVLVPHPPFVFDSVGNPVQNDRTDSFPKDWHEQDKYINQLKFTNNKIRELVTHILETSKIPPVIIIHGDHGSYSTLDNEKYSTTLEPDQYETLVANERLRVFLAIYSGKHECELYDSMSLVNIYPVLLNCIFHSRIALLEDRCYLAGRDVTDKIYF